MYRSVLVFCAILLTSPAWADVLVLKNGKQLKFPGTYEVKGQFVVFSNEAGQVVQLPLKLVDLEKSKSATAELHAKLEAQAELAKAPPPKKEQKKEMSMGEIAAIIESNRDEENQPEDDISIGGENLRSYGENNPRATGTEAAFVPVNDDEADTPEKANTRRDEFATSYQTLNGKLNQVNARIQNLEANLSIFETQAAYNEGPTGGMYEMAEKTREEITKLEQEREGIQKEMSALERNARKAGVRDLKRRKVAPKEEGQENN